MIHHTVTAIAAAMLLSLAGCESTNSGSHSGGTHRMGTPKENYQMSDENMPSKKASGRPTGQASSDGTHRMGTPKENYQMSNENMRR